MLALDLTYTAFLVPIIIAFANDLLTWEWYVCTHVLSITA